VNRLQGNIPGISEGPVEIPPFTVPEAPMAEDLPLSKEILGIIGGVINKAAKAKTLAEALEIAYGGRRYLLCQRLQRRSYRIPGKEKT
jgi:hypothetical protein